MAKHFKLRLCQTLNRHSVPSKLIKTTFGARHRLFSFWAQLSPMFPPDIYILHQQTDQSASNSIYVIDRAQSWLEPNSRFIFITLLYGQNQTDGYKTKFELNRYNLGHTQIHHDHTWLSNVLLYNCVMTTSPLWIVVSCRIRESRLCTWLGPRLVMLVHCYEIWELGSILIDEINLVP